MSSSRRTMLAGSAAGVTSLGLTSNAATAPRPARAELADLIRRSHEANAALMQGDTDRYREFIRFSDDFSFMGPFGGSPTLAAAFTDERVRAIGRFFSDGDLETELVEAYASGDLAVLAVIERSSVRVGGLPKQPWALRVTLVYRRVGAGWELAHRHADPLLPGISLAEAAALTSRAARD